MAITTLCNDTICVILGNFAKFDEFSGLVYSCKRMSRIWKDNKEKFDMLYEIKTKDNIRVFSTIKPKKMEITMENLVWETSNVTMMGFLQSLKRFQFKVTLKIEVIVKHSDNVSNDDVRIYRKGWIDNIKYEWANIAQHTYETLKELALYGNGRKISWMCNNLSDQEYKKLIDKDYCFQSRLWMEVARV